MIPRIIHYCWFGKGNRNRVIRRCIRSWAAVMPEYEIREWNESNLPPENAYLNEVLSRGLWSKAANYVRLYALLVEGGIYLDTDVEALRSFDPLLSHECFIGFQQREDGVDWVNNAILGAQSGHQYIRDCMDATLKAFDADHTILRGPQVATAVLREHGLIKYGLQTVGGVTVYPIEYFSPYGWNEQFSADCVTRDTYTIHRWQASWVKRSPRERVGRVLRSIARTIPGARSVRAALRSLRP